MQTVADVLATPPMSVIITRLVPLNDGGYEIRAECEFVTPQIRHDHDWNDALDVDGNHAEAALELLEKVYGDRHPFKLVMGRRTDDVMVFVQVSAKVVL